MKKYKKICILMKNLVNQIKKMKEEINIRKMNPENV